MPKIVNLRNPELCRDIRELAALTGRSLTATVGDAVHEELERLRRDNPPHAVIPVSTSVEDRDP